MRFSDSWTSPLTQTSTKGGHSNQLPLGEKAEPEVLRRLVESERGQKLRVFNAVPKSQTLQQRGAKMGDWRKMRHVCKAVEQGRVPRTVCKGAPGVLHTVLVAASQTGKGAKESD